MSYYLDLAGQAGPLARWRMAAVLYAADLIEAEELPMEAALLLAADPAADVVQLAGRYRGDDWIVTRELFERAVDATSIALPSFGDAWTIYLGIGAQRVRAGELDPHALLSREFEQFAEYPKGVAWAWANLAEFLDCQACHADYNGEEDIETLASFVDGRGIPEWLALLTDPSRDSPAFPEPVPAAQPDPRGRGHSLAARAIRRIRGGRSA